MANRSKESGGNSISEPSSSVTSSLVARQRAKDGTGWQEDLFQSLKNSQEIDDVDVPAFLTEVSER